jgi:hypothetical protein
MKPKAIAVIHHRDVSSSFHEFDEDKCKRFIRNLKVNNARF